MKATNRKKLATIKAKVINNQFATMSKRQQADPDKEYNEALKILGKALDEIEKRFGYLD